MGFLNTGFTGAFTPLWVALELEAPDPDYQAVLRRFGHAQVIERHDKLEQMVGDGPWLVGDKPSLADALLAGVARWLEYHQVADIARWPKLQAIRRRVEADPAVRFAVALEDGQTPAGSGALKGQVPLAEVIERFGV
jgi:glutathione S-transferase